MCVLANTWDETLLVDDECNPDVRRDWWNEILACVHLPGVTAPNIFHSHRTFSKLSRLKIIDDLILFESTTSPILHREIFRRPLKGRTGSTNKVRDLTEEWPSLY